MRDHNFYEYLSEILKKYNSLGSFLERINESGRLYILGGSVRDSFYKKKNEYTIRDLDLIFSKDIKKIKDILEEYDYSINRFGGYKIKFFDIEIDIWSYRDNWATKNNLKPKIRKNMLDLISYGTLLNIDSLVYDYRNKLIYYDYFKEAYENNTIDFITTDEKYIEANPNRPLNIFRIIYFMDVYKLSVSLQVKNYIQEYIRKHNNYLEEIHQSQLKHYRQEKLKKDEVYMRLKKLQDIDLN